MEVGTYAFRDSVTIRAPRVPGAIHVVGYLSFIGDAQIKFIGSFSTTELDTETHTDGVDKLFEDSVFVSAGESAVISTGPLGGSITIDGNVDGSADIGNLSEDLIIEAGTGDVIILGDIGSEEPLRNLTIISAGNVTIFGSVNVTGEFKILNTTGDIRLGVAQQNTSVGNTTAGSIDITGGSEIIFEGDVQTTDGGAATSIRLSAPNAASGNITFKQTVTTNGDLVIESARNVLFSDVVSVFGLLQQVSGSILTRFQKAVSADDINLQAANITFDSAMSVGAAGNVLLTADEIDFKGGDNTVTSVGVNTSSITLRPISPLTPIRIGSAAGVNPGILDLNNQDILAIADQFDEVFVGWQGAGDPAAGNTLAALTAIASGGDDQTAATALLLNPGADNDLLITVGQAGSAHNGIVIRVTDDNTILNDAATSTYNVDTRILTLNVNFGMTTADKLKAAINATVYVTDTPMPNTPIAAPAAPTFTAVKAGLAEMGDNLTEMGEIVSVISTETAGGLDDAAATATVEMPGVMNDILLTADAVGMMDNGWTFAVIHGDVAAVETDVTARTLTVKARLAASPVGAAHTAADIIAAINALGTVPFTASLTTGDTDASLTGAMEIGAAAFNNPARFFAGSIKVSGGLTVPGNVEFDALYGGIETPGTAVVATGDLVARAAGSIRLNTAVANIQAASVADGNIVISETDSVTINGSGLTTVNGSVSLFTESGAITQDAPVTAGSNLVAGASYDGAGLFEFVPSTLVSTDFLWTKGADDTDFGDDVGVAITASGMFTTDAGATKLVLNGAANMPVSAVVQSNFWSVILQSGGDLVQNDNIATQGGSISVGAGTGSITMGAATSASSAGGNIRYAAGTGIALAELNAGAGDISLIATSGSITDQNMDNNLTAAGVRFETGGIFGQSGDAIESDISTLAGQAALGVFVLETSDLTVGSVSVSTQYLSSDLNMATLSDSARSGLVTTNSGPIVVELTDGSLTVDQAINANGTGNIRLDALAADRDIFLNQGVSSGSGAISVLADRHVTQAAAGDIATVGGSIDLLARDGSITMTNGALTSSGGGAIRYLAGMDVLLGGINSGMAATSVTAVAGSITDNGDDHADIIAASARLVAGMGIGGSAMAAHLDVALGTIAASAGAGGIYLAEADDIVIDTVGPVTVERVALDGTALGGNPQTDAAMSDLVATGAGNIVLQTGDGSITVNEGAPANASGIATDTGNILLVTNAVMAKDKDITLNAPVASNAGSISLIANRNIALAAAGDVSTGGAGTIELEAINGSIDMTDGALIQTANQPVRLKAAQEIMLGGVDAGNSLVSLIAVNGSISDNGDAHDDVAAGTLRLEAGFGFGFISSAGINLIDTAVDVVGGLSGVAGIYLENTRALSIGTAGDVVVDRVDAAGAAPMMDQLTDAAIDGLETNQGNGVIVVITIDGQLSVDQPVTASLGGNIRLEAGTMVADDKDILVNAAVTSGSGHISLLANQDVKIAAAGDVSTGGGSVDIEAANGAVEMTDGAVVTSNGGVIRVFAMGDILVASLNAGTGPLSLNTGAAGSVTDNGMMDIDLVGGSLRIVAGVSVGSAGNHLDTAVSKVAVVAAQTVSGGVFLTDNDALELGSVAAVNYSRALANGTANTLVDAAIEGLLTSAGDAHAVVETIDGPLTVSSRVLVAGAGNVRLAAAGVNGSVDVMAKVSSPDGHVTVVGEKDVIQSNAGMLEAVNGTIDVQAVTGSINMGDGTTATTDGGVILYQAQIDVTIGFMDAGAGTISVIADTGFIVDSGDPDNPPAGLDVHAANLRLVAGNGIGKGDAIDISVDVLAARAGEGGISIIEADAIAVGSVSGVQVNRVNSAGVDAMHPAAAAADLIGLTTTAGDGSIGLLNLDGNLTVDQAVTASGLGNILLQSRTASGDNDKDIVINAAVMSAGGHISVVANRNVTQELGGNILTGGAGSIDVSAQAGSIAMMDDGSETAAAIALGTRAMGILVLDGADNDISLAANLAGVAFNDLSVVFADVAAGSQSVAYDAGANELTISYVSGMDTAADVISLINMAGVPFTADKAEAADAGVITTTATISNVTSGGVDPGSNIRYQAAVDILVGSLNAGNAAVSLVAGESVLDGGEFATDVIASDLRIEAGIGIGAGADHLETAVTNLAAQAAAGGVFVTDLDALTVDARQPVMVNRVSVLGSTSEISDADTLVGVSTISGNGDIVLTTMAADISVNRVVEAHGDGNILLMAANDLLLEAGVQSTSGNISLEAGNDIAQAAGGDVATGDGTIDAQALAGSITMSDGAVTSTFNRNIRYEATMDVTVGLLDAGAGSVGVVADGAILDSDTDALDILAGQLALDAPLGIGEGANHIDISVTTLAAAGSAGIYLTESDSLTVGSVDDVQIRRVTMDGTDELQPDPAAVALSGINTIPGDGSIVLQTLDGSLTVNQPITAGGIGNILLKSQSASSTHNMDMTLNAQVSSSTGVISVLADRNILQTENGVLMTGAMGDIDVQAQNGSITMVDDGTSSAAAITASGNIRYQAAWDIDLASLSSAAGSISLVAGNSILDNGDLLPDLVAVGLRISAVTTVGRGNAHLETSVGMLASRSDTGLYLSQSGDLMVDALAAISVDRVDVDGTTPAGMVQKDEAMSGARTSGNGAIVLDLLTGSLVVNQSIATDGSGNIRLSTADAGQNIALNAVVHSVARNISIIAEGSVTQTASGDILSAGTLDIEAGTGSALMDNGALSETLGGAIRILAAQDVQLGGLVSPNGNVSVTATAGSIISAGGDHRDISAAQARLTAGLGVGLPNDHLKTALNSLAARATSGGVHVADADDIAVDAIGAITVSRVVSNGTTPSFMRQSDRALTEVRTTAGDGNIVLATLNGQLTLNQAVVAHGSGNIRLESGTTEADDKDVAVKAAVISGSGGITILANRDITQNVVGDISTAGGTVDLTSLNGSVTMANGAVTVANGSVTMAGSGAIRILSANSIILGGLDAADVSLIATSGTVTDGGDAHLDLVADRARIVTSSGIGAGDNALETSVKTLASNAEPGGSSSWSRMTLPSTPSARSP